MAKRSIMKKVIDSVTEAVAPHTGEWNDKVEPVASANEVTADAVNVQDHMSHLHEQDIAHSPVDSLAEFDIVMPTTATNNEVKSVSGFEIIDNVEIPVSVASKRGGNTEKYPFSALAAGQSFFIPVTDKVPEPWKKYYGTVNNAQRRYSEVTGEKDYRSKKTGETKSRKLYTSSRSFKMFRGEHNGVAGAFVKRTA